jgi:sugar lactone lactonase YvrE
MNSVLPSSGKIALADATAHEVADGLAFPNGMAVTPDNGTLIVAESLPLGLPLARASGEVGEEAAAQRTA